MVILLYPPGRDFANKIAKNLECGESFAALDFDFHLECGESFAALVFDFFSRCKEQGGQAGEGALRKKKNQSGEGIAALQI